MRCPKYNVSHAESDSYRYDHLVDVIKAIITERPKNVADHFEEFSRRIRRDRYRSDERSQYGFYQSNFQADASLKILAGLTVCAAFIGLCLFVILIKIRF